MKERDLEYKVIGTGSTVLVVEAGIGGSFYDWYPIAEEVKEDFTIILYHRHGYGKSQPSTTERTTENIAKELNRLIESIGIKDKFLLMGHSFGGLCVQHYAKLFTDKLKGLILIDSTSFNFKQLYKLNIPVMNSLISIDRMVESNIKSSEKSRNELKTQNQSLISCYRENIHDTEMADVEAFFTSPLLYRTMAGEFDNWELDSKLIKELACFPDIPLVVIARDNKVAESYWVKHGIPEGEAIEYEAEWRRLQAEQSKLSGQGKLVIADNSDHEVYLDRPDVIIQCLRTFL